MPTRILSIAIYCLLLEYATSISFTSNGATTFSQVATWTPGSSCSTNCYPGGVSGRVDIANVQHDITLATSDTISQPTSLTLNSANTFTLDKASGLLDVAINNGQFYVTKSSSIRALSVAGALNIQAGKTLTTTGAVDFNTGFSITQTSGILNAGSNTVTFNAAASITTAITGSLEIATDVSLVTGGTVSGSVNIGSTKTFTFSGGSMDNTAVSGSGKFSVSRTITASANTFALSSTASQLDVDSSSNAVSLTFSSFSFGSDLIFNCQNDISLIGSTTSMKAVDVSGTNGCTVKMQLPSTLSSEITIADSTFYASTSTSTISSNILVKGTGKLRSDGQTLTVNGRLELQDSASVTPGTFKVSQSSSAAKIILGSSATLSLEYVTASPVANARGEVTVNNPATSVTFQGATTITSVDTWTFQDCTQVTVNQPYDINGDLVLACPTEFKKAVAVQGNGNVGITDDVSISNPFTLTAAGSALTCASGSTIAVKTGGSLTSSSTLNLNSCKLDIQGGSADLSDVTPLDSGTIEIDSGSLTFSTNMEFTLASALNWNGGTISAAGKTLSFDESTFTIAATNPSLSAILDLTDSTMKIQSGATISSGSLAMSGSTLKVAGDTSFSTFPVTSTSSIIEHTSGDLIFNSKIAMSGAGSSVSSTAGTFRVNGALSTAQGTSISVSDLRVGGSFALSVGSSITGTASTISGVLTQAGGISTLSGLSTISGSVTITNSGSIAFSQISTLSGSTIDAKTSGTVKFGTGTLADTTVTADGVGSTIMVTGNSLALGSGTVVSPNAATVSLLNGGAFTISNGGVVSARFPKITGTSGSDPASINILGKLSWNVPSLSSTYDLNLDANLIVTGSGTLEILDGDININTGGSIQLTGGTFTDNAGGLNTAGNAILSVTGGSATFGVATSFTASETVELGGSSISHQGLSFGGNSNLKFSSGSATLPASKTVAISSTADMFVTGSQTVVTVDGTINVSGTTSTITVDNGATLITDNSGTISLTGTSSMNFYQNSEFRLTDTGSAINVGSGVTVMLDNSDFVVTSGVIQFNSGSYLKFYSSSSASGKQSNSGSITMKTGSTIEIDQSSKPTVKTQQAPFVFESGVNLINYGPAVYTSGFEKYNTSSPCDVYDGSSAGSVNFTAGTTVSVEGQGCVIVRNTFMSIQSSLITIKDSATLTITDGAFLFVDFLSQFFVLDSGRLTIANSLCFWFSGVNIAAVNPSRDNLLVSGGSLYVLSDSTLAADTRGRIEDSGFLFLLSELRLQGKSSLTVTDQDSVLYITTGSLVVESFLYILNNGQVFANNGFTLSDGGFGYGLDATILVNTSSSSIVKVTQNSDLELHTSLIQIGSKLQITDFGNMTMVRSELSLQIDSVTSLKDSGRLIFLDRSFCEIQSGVFELNDTSYLLVDDRSYFDFADGNVDFRVNGGRGVFEDFSYINFNQGSLTINSGLLEVNYDATLNMNAGQMEIYSGSLSITDGIVNGNGGSIRVVNDGEILVTNGGYFVLRNGLSCSLYDDAELNIVTTLATKSLYETYFYLLGSVNLYNTTGFLLSNSTGQIFTGSLVLHDASKATIDRNARLMFPKSGFNSIFGRGGKFELNDVSQLFVLTGGTISINNQVLRAKDYSEIDVNAGTINIDGSPLELYGNSTMKLTDGKINVYDDNLMITEDSKLDVTGTLAVLSVEGGNVNFLDNSRSTFTNHASVSVSGDFVCDDTASVKIQSSSTFTVSATGVSDFKGNCSFLGNSQGSFLSSGFTSFTNYAKLTLTGGQFKVFDNDCTFTDSSESDFLSSAQITNSGGNMYFSKNATGTIRQSSILSLQGTGTLFQSDFSKLTITSATLSVDTTLEQTDLADIFCASNADIKVGGTAISRDNSTMKVTTSSTLSIYSSGKAELYDFADWIFFGGDLELLGGTGVVSLFNSSALSFYSDSSASLNGDITLEHSSKIRSDDSEITVGGGSVLASDSSEVSLANGSVMTINAGDLLFSEDSKLIIDGTSSLVVNKGTVKFQDVTNIKTTSGSQITVNDGSIQFVSQICLILEGAHISVGGYVEVSPGSCMYINASSTVDIDGGDFTTLGAYFLQVEDSFLNIFSGDANFNGEAVSTLSFINVDFDIDEGNAFFKEDVKPTFSDGTTFTVQFGSAIFADNTQSTWTDSVLTIQGSVVFRDNASPSFTTSELNVDGSVILRDVVASTFTSSSVSVYGTLTFTGTGTQQFTFTPVDLFDGSVSFENLTNCLFDYGNFIVHQGNANFVENATVAFSHLTFSVLGGNVLISDVVKVQYTNSTVRILNGALSIRDKVVVDLTDTSVFVEAGATGQIEVRDEGEMNLIRSPITMAGGNVLFTNTSVLNILDAESPIQIDIGNMEFYNRAALNTVPGTVINVRSGFFNIWNLVQLDFDQVTVNVAGSVLFNDDTVANFNDCTLHIIDALGTASFETNRNHQFRAINSEIAITNGIVSFSGTASSVHDFEDSTFTVNSGDVLFTERTTPYFLDSVFLVSDGVVSFKQYSDTLYSNTPFTIAGGSFILSDDSRSTFEDSDILIQANSGGSFSAYLNSYLTFIDSNVRMDDGNVEFFNLSVLNFTTAGCTLTVNDGSFQLHDNTTFDTVPFVEVYINAGNFRMLNYSYVIFNQVSMFVAGSVGLTERSDLYAESTSIDISGGLFSISDFAKVVLEQSAVEITDGSLTTYSDSFFTTLESTVYVDGNVIFRGTTESVHDYFTSQFTIVGNGDMEIREFVVANFIDSCVTILGGYFESYDNGESIFTRSCLKLEGVGTLTLNNNSHLVVDDASYIQVSTEGATATFNDNSTVEVFRDSVVNITDGNVSFRDRSVFNVWHGTAFNLLGGSFVLRDNSAMTCYPETNGTIIGGNLYIRDAARLLFIRSFIVILGNVNNNSTNPVYFSDGSNILVNGTVEFSGNGTLFIGGGSFLHVNGGNIILNDSSFLSSDNGTILVSSGSIIVNDFSGILADETTLITVEGGAIETFDDTSFTIIGDSTVIVTATATTAGAVNLHDDSYMYIGEESHLFVFDGSISLFNQSYLTSEDAFVTVSGGNILSFNDTTITADEGSYFIVEGGTITTRDNSNFYITGESTTLVTTTPSTTGYVNVYGHSTIDVSENSNLLVIDGSIIVGQFGDMNNRNDSLIGVLSGNVELYDYAHFNAYPTSTLEVEGEGRFYAAGPGVVANFDHATTRIIEGNFTTAVRTVINSIDSRFEITEAGNVIFTDASIINFLNSTELSINGGGNLEIFREVEFTLDSYSTAEIESGGSALFNEDSNINILNHSTLDVQNGGSIVFSNSTSLLAAVESLVNVNGGGNIVFNDFTNAHVVNSTLSVFNEGSIIFAQDSTAFIEAGAFFYVQDGGNIIFGDNSTIKSMASALAVTGGGSLLFYGCGIIDILDGSEFLVDGGNIEYHGCKEINFSASRLRINDGNLLTFDTTIFNLFNNSYGNIYGGNFALRNASTINMIENAYLNIEKGNVFLANRGKLNMDTARISVSDNRFGSGFFRISDSVEIVMKDSLLLVDGGDFVSTGDILIDSKQSTIEVTSGSAIFAISTNYTGVNSQVEVSGGDLNIKDNSLWVMTNNSIATVNGGDLNLSQQTETYLTDSRFVVTDGDCNVKDNSYFNMLRASLTVTGGNLIYTTNATYQGTLSSIHVSGGRIEYDLSSRFNVVQTSIVVDKNSVAPRINAPITIDDLIVVGGTSIFTASQNTTIYVNRGNFIFVEQARSFIDSTSVYVTGGSIRHSGSSSAQFSSTLIGISAGSLELSESSSLGISAQSVVNITGGSLTAAGASFQVVSSSVSIVGGSAIFSAGTTGFTSSELHVSGSGSIRFIGTTTSTLLNSLATLSGRGVFLIGGSSNVNILTSSLVIEDGNFRTDASSRISFQSSTFSIQGGEVTFGGSSSTTVSGSSFSILGGNVSFQDQSNVLIQQNSNYTVNGGNVFTSGTANLQLQSASCFTISQGSVTYGGSSTVRLVSSCWNVEGGNATFESLSNYELTSSSTLSIKNGYFFAKDNVDLLISRSSVFISGGGLIATDATTLSITENSFVDVMNGHATFTGTIVGNILDSLFSVSGGYVEFNGNTTLLWDNSTLSISQGDLRIIGDSLTTIHDSFVAISGGGFQFNGNCIVNIAESNFQVIMGSVNFLGNSTVSFNRTSLSVTEGDIQFAGRSSVSFLDTAIYLAGQLEFLDQSNFQFHSNRITIDGGNLHIKDHSNVLMTETEILLSGNFYVQNAADIIMRDSSIFIDHGDFLLSDISTLSFTRSNMTIQTGNFIVVNPSDERKYVSFNNASVAVLAGEKIGTSGNVEITGNVEVTLLSSDFVIDGNLIVAGTAKLNVHKKSSFIIPTGVVVMEVSAEIDVDDNSIILNQGKLFAPGSIKVPSDSSYANEGIMETTNPFNSNCFDDIVGASLLNSGSLSLYQAAGSDAALNACIDKIQHTGYLQIKQFNATFNSISTSVDSTTALQGANIDTTSGQFASSGTLGGTAHFTGSFINDRFAVIMANGEDVVTNLQIESSFQSGGTMYFNINSRGEAAEFSQVSANDVQFTGGKACVCFSPYLQGQVGDRFDLVLAKTLLEGRYESIEFGCAECPRRGAKSIEAEDTCDPVASYGTRSFSVLFESCDGGSGGLLDSISPPWYVIFPVSICIIIFLIVFFGGALVWEQRQRRAKSKKNAKAKRRKMLADLKYRSEGHMSKPIIATSSLDSTSSAM